MVMQMMVDEKKVAVPKKTAEDLKDMERKMRGRKTKKGKGKESGMPFGLPKNYDRD